MFTHVAQRRGFRQYLAGLLAPRDRNKTLTALAGAGPVTGSKLAAVQRLQWFLPESVRDPDVVNARRLELLAGDPATAPHGGGVLVIDDSGDRKDGTATAFTGRQWPGRYGKTGNGIVTVTTLWAGEQLYYPLHAWPYTPARRLPGGKNDPLFRAKLQIAADLAGQAQAAGVPFRAVAADCAYGDQDGFRADLRGLGAPFAVALKPHRGTWACGDSARTPVDAARDLAWNGPDHPGDWRPATRRFRDGHAGTWRAGDATLGWRGPDGTTRLVAATADPAVLADKATWYLATCLPRPGSPREHDSPWPAAPLAEVVRIYGLRPWVEQSYKQVKDELGWADFQVRSAIAIRRHQVLVNCAFSFCRDTWLTAPPHPGQHRQARKRGGTATQPQQPRKYSPIPPAPSWPHALRAVRSWLTPATTLTRWWHAWSKAPPPAELQHLLDTVTAGHGLYLYLPP